MVGENTHCQQMKYPQDRERVQRWQEAHSLLVRRSKVEGAVLGLAHVGLKKLEKDTRHLTNAWLLPPDCWFLIPGSWLLTITYKACFTNCESEIYYHMQLLVYTLMFWIMRYLCMRELIPPEWESLESPPRNVTPTNTQAVQQKREMVRPRGPR